MPSSAPYLNFDLLITRAGDRYRALVVDAPGGDADIFFDLPPSLPGFQDLLALTGPRRGLRDAPTQTTPAASLDDVGRLLYESIFQGEVRDVLIASQREAADNTAGLRLRLRFHGDAADLATLPWEILYDAGQERFLALSETLPILRYLSLPRPRPALVTEPPLRILAVLASPDGLDELNLEGEWQVLAEALAPLVDDGKVVLERLASPTPSALQGRLLGDPVHVLHFVGHGVFDEDSRQGMLVLADERNQPKLMGARELATLLANHTSLRLLYLNACEGALGDNANVFAGLAQRLVQRGAPAAIAMQAEISDRAGIDLARTFYTALATGRPVDAALTQARVTLAMNSSVEWATPVLFSRAPDNRLFDIRDVLPTPDCPYPGMKPFREDQQAYFFGRDKEIDDAVNRLAKHPFLAVVGPSGSGKSSLVYAGILPALRASRRFGPGPWTVHTLRPSDARTAEGKAAPMQALSRLMSGQLSVISDQSSEPECHASIPDPQSPVTNPQSPTLLFIDQFEETFTLADAAERTAFLDAVHGLIGQPNLYILLTVRADFYADMMAMGDLWEDVQARRLELTPLGEDGLWAAIVEPAARVGVDVEDALATALIADARGEAGVLPLVQETLVRLWDKVEGRQLKRSAYRQMADGGRSGIQVAINDHANDIYHTLPAADRPIARRIFLRLIQFGEGRADTRRQQTVAELRAGGDDPVRFDETLRALVDGRLLTSSGEEGDPNRRVDISHEALIGGWALLQGWIGEKRVAESMRRRLEEKVAEWLRLERSGGLLDEYEVQEAEGWLGSDYSSDLGHSQALLELVNASKAVLAQAKEEKAEAERTRQRARVFAGGLALAVLAIALVGWFGWAANKSAIRASLAEDAARWAQNEAEIAATQEAEQRQTAVTAQAEAEIQAALAAKAEATAVAARAEVERLTRGIRADQLTSNALQVVNESPPLALLLAVEGLRVQADFTTTRVVAQPVTPENPVLVTHTVIVSSSVVASARNNVYDLLDQVGGKPLSGLVEEIHEVGISPNGSWLAVGGEDGAILLWDMENLEREPMALPKHDNSVHGLTFSPDSHWLATGSPVDDVHMWNMETNTLTLLELPDGEDGIWDLRFSPDGRWLAALSFNKLAVLWPITAVENADAYVVPLILQGYDYEEVESIEFSPDNRWIVTSTADGHVWLWDTTNLQAEPIPAPGREGITKNLEFSPSAKWLAGKSSVWSDGESHTMIHLQDMSDPEADPLILRAGRSEIHNIAFHPNGGWYATTSSRGDVQLWDISSPNAEPVDLQGHDHQISDVAFSPDGQWVAGWSDKAIHLWNMEQLDTNPVVLRGHETEIMHLEFGPDSQRLVTSSGDELRIWDLQQRSILVLSLHGHESAVLELTISPDGRWLASGSRDNTVRLWDTRDPTANPKVFEGHQSSVIKLEFDPTGRWIASGAVDGSIRLWNIDRLEENPILLEGGNQEVWNLEFSPDGRWLASSYSWLDEVWLWDTEDFSAAPTVLEHENLRIMAIVFSPDSRWLASGDINSESKPWLWDLTDLQSEPLRLEGHQNQIESLAFSPDGHWLVSGSSQDAGIRLWDMSNPQGQSKILSGGTSGSLAFSRDGRRLIWPMFDSMRLQDVTNPHADPFVLSGHEAGKWTISSDEVWLAGAGWNEARSVGLWHIERPEDPPVVLRHPSGVKSIAFDPGRQWLAAGTTNGVVHLWRYRTVDLMAALCDAAGRNLTVEEWNRYFPGQVYRKSCRQWPVHRSVTQRILNAARDLANQGDIENAALMYKEALSIDPALNIDPISEAKSTYGSTLFREAGDLAWRGDVEQAVAKYEEGKKYFPAAEFDPIREAGQLYARRLVIDAEQPARQGNIEQAIGLFNKAMEYDPSLDLDPEIQAGAIYASTLVEQARDLARQGNGAAALEAFEQAWEHDPSLVFDFEAEVEQLLPKSITYGDVVTGTVGSKQEERWLFQGEVEDVVTIHLQDTVRGRLDCYLILYDPFGEELASNDDFDGTDSLINTLILPDSGVYTIVAKGAGGSWGEYRLSLVLEREKDP